MKKFYYRFGLLLSFLIFCALIIKSSPYRELRPYVVFMGKTSNSTDMPAISINGRISLYIPGNNEIESFYIEQIPVTIQAYKHCIASGYCQTQHYRNNYAKFWNSSLYNSFPVTFVTWMEAQTYCKAYGGDLPSEAQWKLAAGSDFKYDYPWGNSLPTISRANIDGFYQWLTPAGWLPSGASPYGILDMTGNVREWVLDEIFEDNDNKLLKGGSDHDAFSDGMIDSLYNHGPTSSGFNRGFRCVFPAK